MARKQRTPQEQSADPAAQQMLIRAKELGLGTAFTTLPGAAPSMSSRILFAYGPVTACIAS